MPKSPEFRESKSLKRTFSGLKRTFSGLKKEHFQG